MNDEGFLADWLDPLRLTAQTDLAPFQTRDRFGDLAGRHGGFALFILDSLQRLIDEPRLVHFGLKVEARISVPRDNGSPTIVVAHQVTAIEGGTVATPLDVASFYNECFPFNAVLEGSYAIERSDLRTQRYFRATAAKALTDRRAVVTELCAEASAAFSIAELQVVPPPAHGAIPFISEPL